MDAKRQKLDNHSDIDDIIIYDPEDSDTENILDESNSNSGRAGREELCEPEVQQENEDVVAEDDEELKSLLESWGCPSLYNGLHRDGVTYESIKSLEESDYALLLRNNNLTLGEMVIFRGHHRKWIGNVIGSKTKISFVDLKTILKNGGEKAAEITAFFKEKLHLNDTYREQLVSMIIKANHELSRSMMNNLADQICIIFPGEKKSLYYEKKVGQNPTGLLYVRYNQSRATKLTTRSVLSEENTPDLLTDDVQENIKFVNDSEKYTDLTKTDLLFEHWRACYAYRYSKEYTAEDALNAWPVLRERDSISLIKDDFLTKFGGDIGNSLISKWNTFIFKNSMVISEYIKNAAVRRSFLRSQSDNDLSRRDKEIMKSFHNLHFVVPTKTTTKKKTWTPTIADSLNAFIKVVKSSNVILDSMKKQRDDFADKDIPHHPIVFEVQKRENSDFYVAVCDVVYECESLIDAVDSAFKFFVMFNIEFPPQCKNFWIFLNAIFYKISLPQEANFKITSILNSFEF